METELGRWRCSTQDVLSVVVVEYQYQATSVSGAPVRRYPGARRLALSTGEQVRYIDVSTFEIIVTGELLSRIN